MAVALQAPDRLAPVPGIRLAAAAAGIRYPGRYDLVLIDAGPQAAVAALFTTNAFSAAPVRVAKEHLAGARARWLLINSGNANAGTGSEGLSAARQCCKAVARQTQGEAHAVLPFSTGVIGEPLPVHRIEDALPDLVDALREDAWLDAARAIMTTDTVLKGGSRRVELAGGAVTLTGIAKGSGMVHPDMATMLAFVGTDAEIPPDLLRWMLVRAAADSFNAITVDGDTSTNDALVCVASGASGVQPESEDDLNAFAGALQSLCLELAEAIVRDGEGATKFVRVSVRGGRDAGEAQRVAETVALSPLVKTALFASDPNWGRILAAVGRAGVPDFEIERVRITVNGVEIVAAGSRAPGYTEAAGQQAFAEAELDIVIDLGRGAAGYRKYTCDFSYDYVRINADYRS
ncbi:Glutamate N-acetyltransferase / N-acetylglutamate synthase [Thioalkalivibrio nitratireducens DSM 14787]|uniref:Arginine biosynthesis bifunctional protein ArgJ n=1 Tax=Thioalkalivibrio nitratireducens (strain DSM 14787 / UNIQEM 213 / ALEN2) TaxID=1255043 RepID=L0DZ44_THIND|nr:bifunctional glutamate N-acetyltransferase/amino-acid acetyltransferase ArgJ [Thioalkalivibrio nitratireducens]AGA34235.1 Glutamate N-acetyltransferase / N-acetylglutamate synthase [Thioalkalivibrio nitratireducens DSM 14787]